jgi:hypothetical protein
MPAKPHTGTGLPFSAYRTAEVRTRQLESLAPWPPLFAESPAALLTGAWLFPLRCTCSDGLELFLMIPAQRLSNGETVIEAARCRNRRSGPGWSPGL